MPGRIHLPPGTRTRIALAAAAGCLLAAAGCAVSIGNQNGSGRFVTDEDRRDILYVLEQQAEAWNRGDLEGFMQGYWHSSDLVFTSGGRVQRGWQTTLDRYRATYGNSPSTMGRLAFYDVEIHPMGDSAWVLGRWTLDREHEEVGGVFTLVFQVVRGRWVIVHDHTSVSTGP